jgi:hypothetical protein
MHQVNLQQLSLLACPCREFARVAKHVIRLAERNSQRRTLLCCLELGICKALLKRRVDGDPDVSSALPSCSWQSCLNS